MAACPSQEIEDLVHSRSLWKERAVESWEPSGVMRERARVNVCWDRSL